MPAVSRARPSAVPHPDTLPRNEIVLVGRLAAGCVERNLPSGDLVVQFRVVVARTGRPGVDTIDCAAWTAALRRRVFGWAPGDLVQVTGSLRRRFWRGPAGSPASRYEVEVSAVRRVRRATMTG